MALALEGLLMWHVQSFGTKNSGMLSGLSQTAALHVNSALHPSGVAKSSTSFDWGKGWNVTSAGWQLTLCDPIWHVNSSSGEACCELLYPVTYLQ